MNNNMDNSMNTEGSSKLSVDSIIAEFKAEELHGLYTEEPAESTPLPEQEGSAFVAFDFAEEPVLPSSEAPPPISAANDEPAPLSTEEILAEEKALGQEDYFGLMTAAEDAPSPPTEDTQVFKKQTSLERPVTEETQVWARALSFSAPEGYAPAGNYGPEAEAHEQRIAETRRENRQETDPGFFFRLLSPVVGLAAAAASKREEKQKAARSRAKAEAKHQPPEMNPETAARFYMDQAQSIKLRLYFSAFLSLVLVYLSYGLPALGVLGASSYIRTFVMLILQLIVMLVSLDVFTGGMVGLIRGRPGPESLAVISCLVSLIHALYILISKNTRDGLPFSAVSALSMTFALLGSYLNCRSFALNFRTAAVSKAPSVVLSANGGESIGPVLLKAQRPVTGFVRKTEEADLLEKVYRLLAPLLLAFALVLSLFCFLASGKCNNFIHTLSAAVSVTASFSAVLGFALPFYVLTKRLVRSGAAIAGYAGCAELGKIGQLVIKDKDIFPARTLSIANVNISEGFYPDKVISCTASMISAAGLGLAPLFSELMRKNGSTLRQVEDFACHEGGGIIARADGDQVYVGSSGFMQLMGIRVRKGEGSNSAVYTAINDSLAGIFEIGYVPVASVQRGLTTLLRGRSEPVFAVRDFNITPMLIKQKFRLPKASYDFPSFADRYAVSSEETEESGSVAAVFARGGLNAVAGLIRRGRTLYLGLLLCTALSVLGAFAGMLLMLSMCWGGHYASASASNAISFMLLWLVPVLVVSWGLRR